MILHRHPADPHLRHYKPSPSLPYNDGSPGVPPDLQCLLPKELSGPLAARMPDQPAWPGYYPSSPGHLMPRTFSIQDSTGIVPQHRSLYLCHQPRDSLIGPLGSTRHHDYASPRTALSGLTTYIIISVLSATISVNVMHFQ